MGLLFKIALRNLLRRKRRSLLTGISLMGGTLMLSVFLGIQEGSYSLVIEQFTQAQTGHVQIHRQGYLDKPSLYNSIPNPQPLLSRLQADPAVTAASPRVYSPALAFAGKKTTAAQVVGIDLAAENRATGIQARLALGRFFASPNEVVVGRGLAEILKLELGSELVLVTQGADGSIANDLFQVTGILKGGEDSQNRMFCYLALADAQAFLTLDHRIHEIALFLPHYSRATEQAAAWAREFAAAGLEVHPWPEVEKEFYEFMLLDKEGGYVTYLIIVVLVALQVLNTVLMTILEKTRELGLLKALGTRPPQIFGLILLETMLLACLAIAAGLLLAWPLNQFLAVEGIKLPQAYDISGITMDRIVSEISFFSVWLPALATFVTALAVSILPALRAARIQPIHALNSY